MANSLIAQFSFYRKILEHGKHVLVDFPLCLTAEGGKKIFDLAESKGMYIKFSVLTVKYLNIVIGLMCVLGRDKNVK